jgi:hypothetical protein
MPPTEKGQPIAASCRKVVLIWHHHAIETVDGSKKRWHHGAKRKGTFLCEFVPKRHHSFYEIHTIMAIHAIRLPFGVGWTLNFQRKEGKESWRQRHS